MNTIGMGLSRLVLFVFLATFSIGSAAAQTARETVISVDAGAVQIQQRSREATVSGMAALSARHATRRLALSAAALAFQSNDSSGAVQGSAGAEFLLPYVPNARMEASVSATTFGTWGDRQGRSHSGYIRPQFARERFGLYGTLGAGGVKRGAERFHALDWDVGAWTQQRMTSNGSVSVNAAFRQSFTNDFPLVEDLGFLLLDSLAYHYAVRDIEATITSRWKRVEVQLNGVWRNGIESTRGHAGALSALAIVNLSSRFALTVNAGEQLADFRTGVPSARLYGASLRWHAFHAPAVRASSPSADAAESRATQSRAIPRSPLATEVVRRAEGGATVRVRLRAPEGARVEVSGSYNDWAIVPVPRVGDLFEVTLDLPKGTHRVAIRVNGGNWRAPQGLARIRDDLGGEAGLVVVP